MKPSHVLKELDELRVAWRKQNLTFNTDQRRRYEELRLLRKQIVLNFFKDGKVYVKPSAAVLKKEEQAKQAAAEAAAAAEAEE